VLIGIYQLFGVACYRHLRHWRKIDCVNPEGGGSLLSGTLLATNWHGIIFQNNLIFDIYIFYPLFRPLFTCSFIPLYSFFTSLLIILPMPFFYVFPFPSFRSLSLFHINLNSSSFHYFFLWPLLSLEQWLCYGQIDRGIGARFLLRSDIFIS
jgi:hypothetical protein